MITFHSLKINLSAPSGGQTLSTSLSFGYDTTTNQDGQSVSTCTSSPWSHLWLLQKDVSWTTRLRDQHTDEKYRENETQENTRTRSAVLQHQQTDPGRTWNRVGHTCYLPEPTPAALNNNTEPRRVTWAAHFHSAHSWAPSQPCRDHHCEETPTTSLFSSMF